MTLDSNFENFQVCHATGIEKDIIRACCNFCLHYNIPDFNGSWVHDTMIDYLTTDDSMIDLNDLAYFVNETLMDYMGDHSPIGCYFGSHRGDWRLGYWRILEYEQIGYEYEDCKKLPYKESGYPVFNVNDCIGDKLSDIGNFLETYYTEAYPFTDLWETIQELSVINFSNEPLRESKFAEKVIDSFVKFIVPLIAPVNLTWQKRNDHYGLYPELPGYEIKDDKERTETVDNIFNSNLFTVLLFIVENKASKELHRFIKKSVHFLAMDIIDNPHYMSFGKATNKAKNFDHSDMADYICANNPLLTWIIEKVFWNDYKDQIDKILGSQDITRLFLDILPHISYGEDGIDGINEDVYSLRESCNKCENLEIESDEIEDSDCDCVDFNELNSVWIVSELRFYEALEKHGAMIYQTDSLYLYLQTDFSGNYYDDRLRKAFVEYGKMAWLGSLL